MAGFLQVVVRRDANDVCFEHVFVKWCVCLGNKEGVVSSGPASKA